MKLNPVTFHGAFIDGLVQLDGHEFEAAGRMFVVHKLREPYCDWDKSYLVSDKETGFQVPIQETRSRAAAVRLARDQIEKKSPEALARAIGIAMKARAKLVAIPQS